MKYVVVLGDGMPDYPLEELGKTPLEYAHTPKWISSPNKVRLVW